MIPFACEAEALAWMEREASGEVTVFYVCPVGNTYAVCGCPCVTVVERYRVA